MLLGYLLVEEIGRCADPPECVAMLDSNSRLQSHPRINERLESALGIVPH
jgi:hypothetical protein